MLSALTRQLTSQARESGAYVRKAKLTLSAVMFSVTLAAAPVAASAETYHTVRSGDNLWKISRAYGVPLDQLKKLNSLESSLIFPGQTLLVAKDDDGAPAGDRSPAVEVSRGTSRIEKILDYAKSFVGVPYLFGGQSPRGFDCSGYIKYVFRNFGIDTPRTAAEQFAMGRAVTEQEAKPGDIVAFRAGGEITHTGIYLGGGKFISATSSHGVEISSVYGYYWKEHFSGFSRIIP